MRPSIKMSAVVLTLSLAAYAAYAENVTISTFYPSPYGSYQTLATTGDTHLATVAAGKVGIGTTTPNVASKVDVQGGSLRVADTVAANAPSAYIQGNAIGAYFGAPEATRPAYIGNGENFATIAVDNTNVGIGTAAPVAGSYKLDVNGNTNVQGTVRLRDPVTAQPGVLRVSCDGTDCYAVYGP